MFEGKLIVIDGNEGSGKSTQCKLLKEHMEKEGYDVAQFDEPGTTEIGLEIRKLLLHKKNVKMSWRAELMLFMAARAQLVDELITPALEARKVVILDRYVSSTLAYQQGEDQISAHEIQVANMIATKTLWPTWTLILKMPGMHKGKLGTDMDRIETRGDEFFKKVQRQYDEQVTYMVGTTLINAEGSPEVVHDRIWRFLHR